MISWKRRIAMNGKTVKETTTVMTQLMEQHDANLAGNVHGGSIMYLIDTIAGVTALKHARSNVVTASIDRLDFIYPAYIGDLLTLRASINIVGRSSIEVGVRVESENLMSGEIRHTASAYLTFIALNKEGRPMAVAPLILETDDEIRRNREARARKEMRLRERKKEDECQKNFEKCDL
jgi:acyl-CoA hydrolase